MTVAVFVGTSLDGFLARPDGALDFLPADGGGDTSFESFLASVDALVMGRSTFETVKGFGGPWPYGDKPVIVLAHRTLDLSWAPASVRQMAGTPKEVVEGLAKLGLRKLYVDGGVTIQEFLRAGLVDRLIVTRVPVLIGSGRPLFGPLAHDVKLRHVGTKTLGGGLVQSEYEVVR